jgi:hypothetical protein
MSQPPFNQSVSSFMPANQTNSGAGPNLVQIGAQSPSQNSAGAQANHAAFQDTDMNGGSTGTIPRFVNFSL